MIRKVAIVGGTHGNELTGVYLLKRWEQLPAEITRPSFTTDLFLGNPKAVALNRRFVDVDLNRSFGQAALALPNDPAYETQRAFYLRQSIAPVHDFIIDMHTSTTTCGAMLILLDEKPFHLRLAAYIISKVKDAKVLYIPAANEAPTYLNSICPHSLGVEIGPVPQGVLRSDVLHLTAEVVQHTLDFIHMTNEGTALAAPKVIEVFRFKKAVFFPTEGASLSAMVHPSLQDADYLPLEPGAPMFETLDGLAIAYDGEETVYPVFINEAAYYYQHIAMSFCVKQTLAIPSES